MESGKGPTPDKQNTVSATREYFRIRKAAEILGCEVEDLLHLGVMGNAQIMAPVLTEARFELWRQTVGLAYPEIDEPFRAVFGPEHRVILSRTDLARIEATGWSVPHEFACPSKTLQFIEDWETFNGEVDAEASDRATDEMRVKVVEMWESRLAGITEEALAQQGYDGDLSVEQARTQAREGFERELSAADEDGSFRVHVFKSRVKPDPQSDEATLQAIALYDPWHVMDPMPDDAPRTTIDHLFLAKTEVERLEKRLPQDGVTLALKGQLGSKRERAAAHGNSERFAIPRVQVLTAAIFCKETWPNDCRTAAEWTRCLEQHALEFWPSSGEAPLTTDTIERLLSSALKKQDLEGPQTGGSKKSSRK